MSPEPTNPEPTNPEPMDPGDAPRDPGSAETPGAQATSAVQPVVPVEAVDLGLTPLPETIGVRQGAFGISGSGDTSGFSGLRRPIVMPGQTQPPFGPEHDEMVEEFALALRDGGLPVASALERIVVDRGEITFHVRRERLLEVARTLRDEPGLRFEVCHSVSGVHYPGDPGRELRAVIHLLSMTHRRRLRLEVSCPEDDPHVPSVVGIWPAADWHERETWDMFGVVFDGHPALTRVLMPDDWPGHPQRKDYPLGGIPVEFKGATIPPPDQRRAYT